MDDRTKALIAKYSPSPSKTSARLARSPSPEALRSMRFAPSSPRVKASGRSPSPIKAGRAAWSPEERTAAPAAWPHGRVQPISTPAADPPRTVMDFPPRAARRWDEDETVPRAEFDAYVRSTERVLSQLQAAVDGHSVGPNLQDRLVAQERRLHALERGWHETLKRVGVVEETAGRPPDLKLVEARCSWLEDELREQSAQVSGMVSPDAARASSEQSLHEFKELLRMEMRQELEGLQQQLASETVPPARFARWENCIKEEMADSAATLEALRVAVSEQSVARDAQLTAIEQAVRRLQRASVPPASRPSPPKADGTEAALAKAREQATADAKARRDAEEAARKLGEEKQAAEAEAVAVQELLRVERLEREELAADLVRLQLQASPPAVHGPPSPPPAEDTEKRLEQIWKAELASTERRLSSDMDMLRSRNLELEQQLADAQAAAAAAAAGAASPAASEETAIGMEPYAFPAAPQHAPKLRKVSCVIHVGGLEGEELEDEAKLSVRRSLAPSCWLRFCFSRCYHSLARSLTLMAVRARPSRYCSVRSAQSSQQRCAVVAWSRTGKQKSRGP